MGVNSIGILLQLIGMFCILIGCISMIIQGFLIKKDKKIRNINTSFINIEKINDMDKYCIWLGDKLIKYGISLSILTLIFSTLSIANRDLELVIMLPPVFMLILYFRIYHLTKLFYN